MHDFHREMHVLSWAETEIGTDFGLSRYLSWLLDTEAIPMARRAYARRATVSEIARRLGVLVHAESIGSLERCRSNSSHLAQQVWYSASNPCVTDSMKLR